jgi:hypothetical protein
MVSTLKILFLQVFVKSVLCTAGAGVGFGEEGMSSLAFSLTVVLLRSGHS